jgi:hypothetical protein
MGLLPILAPRAAGESVGQLAGWRVLQQRLTRTLQPLRHLAAVQDEKHPWIGGNTMSNFWGSDQTRGDSVHALSKSVNFQSDR